VQHLEIPGVVDGPAVVGTGTWSAQRDSLWGDGREPAVVECSTWSPRGRWTSYCCLHWSCAQRRLTVEPSGRTGLLAVGCGTDPGVVDGPAVVSTPVLGAPEDSLWGLSGSLLWWVQHLESLLMDQLLLAHQCPVLQRGTHCGASGRMRWGI
jgi:hypothetical protein